MLLVSGVSRKTGTSSTMSRAGVAGLIGEDRVNPGDREYRGENGANTNG
jgi:hypothetical protein